MVRCVACGHGGALVCFVLVLFILIFDFLLNLLFLFFFSLYHLADTEVSHRLFKAGMDSWSFS